MNKSVLLSVQMNLDLCPACQFQAHSLLSLVTCWPVSSVTQCPVDMGGEGVGPPSLKQEWPQRGSLGKRHLPHTVVAVMALHW